MNQSHLIDSLSLIVIVEVCRQAYSDFKPLKERRHVVAKNSHFLLLLWQVLVLVACSPKSKQLLQLKQAPVQVTTSQQAETTVSSSDG